MELQKYHLIEKIGGGSYGEVFKAKEKATGRSIAVKLIKINRNACEREKKDQKKFLKECSIHSSLRHPNIIQMLDSFETVDYIVVATELAGIDLHRFMSRQKLTDKQVQRLTWHLLSALYYLHSQRVSHRDLKPQNILLNNYQNADEMEAKLCDFGLARKMTSETYLLTSVKGTPLYMAPEVMDLALYDERADLWSLGCVIYEANFGKPPIKTHSFSQLMKWLKNPEILWPSTISDESKSFLQGVLKKEPKMRLTWPQILDHPYVKDNLLILNTNKADRPLTEDLTTSQQIRKDKQRKEIILHRDKKMIAAAMIKCQAKGKISKDPLLVAGPPNAQRKRSNCIGDNESISSDDSINAIIQTDLETDVEGPLIKKETKIVADQQLEILENQNFVIKRYTENFAEVTESECVVGDDGNENANLQVGTMLENMEKMQLEDETKQLALAHDGNKNASILDKMPMGNHTKTNTDLVKRKLNQNLDNFSIRLGNEPPSTDRTGDENNKDNSKEKLNTQTACTTQSSERSGVENSDTKPDAYEDDQSPPFENEEWLAFIHESMKEVLNGETDSLKQQNLVGIIVAILRNFNASSNVICSVVQLLSIPFVLPFSSEDLAQIRTVYVQTKLLPNLVFASKIVCMVRGNNPSFSSTLSSSNFGALGSNQDQVVFRPMSDLSVEDLKTLASIYELVCYLIHLDFDFVGQFIDSVYIIANDLLRHLLSDVVYDSQGMQIVCAIVSTLCYVLRETPENAEVIESVIFHESVDVITLVNNGNVILKSRLCNFLKIISRFSCFALQKAWTPELKQTLEGLLDDGNVKVKEAALDTIGEIGQLAFYSKVHQTVHK